MVRMQEKHRKFVDSYLMHGNGERAALEAGYSEVRARRTGSELLRNPGVAAAIRKAQVERSERMGVDADWIVQQTVEVIEQARLGVPKVNRGEVVRMPGEGGELGEVVYEPQLSAAVSGLNTLVKVLGIGAPERREVEHTGEVIYTLRVDQRPAALEIGETE
jgi:phage terminase small subunit